MLVQDPQVVSADVMVRYLAVFQRFLKATVEYTRNGDKAGMLIVGWMAHVLHLVPAMLWHYDDYYRSPFVMDRWLQQTPARIGRWTPPKHVIHDCERIFSMEGGAAELGLHNDLADFDLAPLPAVRKYLDLLHHACLMMMSVSTYSTRHSLIQRAVEKVLSVYHAKVSGKYYAGSLPFLVGSRGDRKASTQAIAEANMRIAEVLMPVPQAVVRWAHFDEERFRKSVLDAAQGETEAERLLWSGFVNGWDADLDYRTLWHPLLRKG